MITLEDDTSISLNSVGKNLMIESKDSFKTKKEAEIDLRRNARNIKVILKKTLTKAIGPKAEVVDIRSARKRGQTNVLE